MLGWAGELGGWAGWEVFPVTGHDIRSMAERSSLPLCLSFLNSCFCLWPWPCPGCPPPSLSWSTPDFFCPCGPFLSHGSDVLIRMLPTHKPTSLKLPSCRLSGSHVVRASSPVSATSYLYGFGFLYLFVAQFPPPENGNDITYSGFLWVLTSSIHIKRV